MPARRISRGGTRGTVFGAVARLRIEDAQCLHREGRYNGAVYLAGYAVECQLKFAYCRQKGLLNLPESFETHDWDRLVQAAGLLPDIRKQTAIYAIYSALADQWGPALRYQTTRYTTSRGNQLYREMEQLYKFLNELVP